MAKLTPGQKAARETVRAAARAVIKEVDSMNWRKECTEFVAHFHLECWRYDKDTFQGRPVADGMSVYRRAQRTCGLSPLPAASVTSR